jgi:hypothetical protein
MYGNCLTFAIGDFIENGGEFIVSFSKRQWFPHFAVQRGGKVHDFEIVKMILYVFLYNGEPRITNAEYYDHVSCRRFRIAKIGI